MKIRSTLQHDICALFDVAETGNGGCCIVTPMQYSGSNDHVVIHVRPENTGWKIHDNGDAVLNANLLGFDTGTDALERWATELKGNAPVVYDPQSECLIAHAGDERLVAPYVIRVAEAAQQLFSIATQRHDRRPSNFKEQLADVVASVAAQLHRHISYDHELPIAGGLKADFVIEAPSPLIIIAATSAARLMEAELIFMQLRHQQLPGFVLAIAENPQAVGRKQFERANYYTGKTVSFDPRHLAELVKDCLAVK